MKKFCTGLNCFRTALGKIHLVDKCLIVFMVVLLVQSAINLFTGHTESADVNNIDVIVRTSTAAIFGYFLSANFIRHASSGSKKGSVQAPPVLTEPGKSSGMENRIGFTASSESATEGLAKGFTGSMDESGQEVSTANRLQIFAAAGIGLFCLIILVLLRNISGLGDGVTATPSSAATVAQFRDFVSGCVGFLIGCPTSKGDNQK